MHQFDEQTAVELEFDKIKSYLLEYCVADTSRKSISSLKPYQTVKEVNRELGLIHEFQLIKNDPEGDFPRIDFSDLSIEIKKLRIEGYILPLEAFIKLLHNSVLCNELIQYMEDHEGMYPQLERIFKRAGNNDIIIDSIETVFDKKMKIKNDASHELFNIRSQIRSTKRQINRNFEQVLKRLNEKGYLGDTKESYINERRVLTVISNYKRKINGKNLGVSKTGGFTYIEPQINEKLNLELEALSNEERDEILRILKELTHQIRKELPLIKACQKLLNRLDFIQAKYRFANLIHGVMPKSSESPVIDMIDALHPLLYLSNLKNGQITHAQSIVLSDNNHILVISGPNAGGKSITLKTIGLLQLMWQSGLMVPVNRNSTFGWFEKILTDIGDNQSIENQLSTYSYRLNRMNYFLKEATPQSLLLLDEFGSGSDPELGGALAEAIFESLYTKKSYAVLTTHYANIKLTAASMDRATNACMLFDQRTLAPTFELAIGQPGSSFTFEVAKMNGIPEHLIKKAKSKLSTERVKMDELIHTLQMEKSVFQRRNQSLKDKETHTVDMKSQYEEKIKSADSQKKSQRDFIQQNNKLIISGKKMVQFIDKFVPGRNNKSLLTEIKKYLAIEKSKITDITTKKEQRTKAKRIGQKKISSKKKKKSTPVITRTPVLGDKVLLLKTKQTGIIDSIDKGKAYVIVGNFKIQSKLSDLKLKL